jgi:phosphoribosylformylglycinamidine synthase PurS subunit
MTSGARSRDPLGAGESAAGGVADAAASPHGAAGELRSFSCELVVRPRDGARDPQADALGEALAGAGFSGFSVGCAGRYLRLDVRAESAGAARACVDEMCRVLLVNPNLETYQLRVEER